MARFRSIRPVSVSAVTSPTAAQRIELHNPLNLEVAYVEPGRDFIPPNSSFDTSLLSTLRASMRNHGWYGAPIVGSPSLFRDGYGTAYTGSHRVAVWRELFGTEPVPVVSVEDLCAAVGIDFEALRCRFRHEPEAVVKAAELMPESTREHYGLHVWMDR